MPVRIRYESHGMVAATATCLVSIFRRLGQTDAYGDEERDLVDVNLGE